MTAQYPWERFCIVRTVLADEGDFRINRVELVAKEMHAVLTVAKFPAIAIAKAEENRWNKVDKYENPLAAQLRTELSYLMSLPDQGYIQEHDLRQLI